MRTVASCLLALALVPHTGCDRESKQEFPTEIGIGDGTTEPPPGMYTPVGRGDLDDIARVGRWLHVGARALELADATVVERMGTVDADVVLPLVDIDPEGTSGQVLFIRWPGAKNSGKPLRIEDAQRWVLVAMMFGPDRVIDIELLQGEVHKDTVEERRVQALLVAGAELQKRVPGAAFFTVDRFQVEPTGAKKTKKQKRTATVVFALAQDPDGPDFEIATDEPPKAKKKKRADPPAVVRVQQVHAKGTAVGDPIVVALPDPHPLSITRVMRAARAGRVQAQSGTYEVAVDGTIARMTSAP